MNIKKHIPNALTCCNLLCGCFGILFTIHYQLDIAFYLVLIAALFDFLDGFVARILNVSSPIGKDLDSLADIVTFGVLPGFIMYRLIAQSLLNEGGFSTAAMEVSGPILPSDLISVPIIAFIIPVFSALRLAKFNNDTRQSDSFIGVNTPANTLLISSLGYILVKQGQPAFPFRDSFLLHLLNNYYALSALTVMMSFLLVSELPIFALKFKNFGWQDNKIRYVFLIIAGLLLILFRFFAFPFIIFLYILLSIVHRIIIKQKKINS